MTKTRFTQGIVLACMTALAACTSGDDGVGGNTELIVVIPNGGPALGGGSSAPGLEFIASVEYTIDCAGGQQPTGGFLPGNPGGGSDFVDAVQINGNLEVRGGRENPPDSSTVTGFSEVWQGFMDIPPGDCSVQLRAKDSDGEVICTDTVAPVTILPSTLNQVSLALICDVSFQAPVGSLDVDGTFQFRVGNFCPDLFVLNCLTEELVEQQITPTLSIFASECQVRARDGDKQCGNSCDDQTCKETPEGLTCTPGQDPSLEPGVESGLTTTVTCVGTLPKGDNDNAIDCDGNPFSAEEECVFSGDLLGKVGQGPVRGGPFPGTFYLKGANLQPGSGITCTAVSTDGDKDCDKTKVLIAPKVPGLGPCDQYADDGFVCDNLNDCQTGSCNDGLAVGGSCGTNDDGPCCEYVDDELGSVCTSKPAPAECDGAGNCVSQSCVVNGCPDDGISCTAPQTCNTTTTLCEPNPPAGEPSGTPCDAGAGASSGACDGAGACQDICSFNPACPDDSNVCTVPSCDPADGTCSLVAGNEGGTCDFNVGQADGVCQAGSCIFAPDTCNVAQGGPQVGVVQVGCTNSLTDAQSPFPFSLSVDAPVAIVGGGVFSVTLGGIGVFPQFFLDAAQGSVPGGVKLAELVDFVSTVEVRSGASGPDVPLGLDLATLNPGALRFCNFPADLICTANGDCLGGVCNPPKIFQEVPNLDGVPNSPGGCSNDNGVDGPGSQLPPDCDCSGCAALGVTEEGQCTTNGFCVTGPILVAFEAQPGNYTAGASGEVLWGWSDVAALCPGATCTEAWMIDGCLDIPPPGATRPTFLSPAEPIGIRVKVPGLNIPIQCSMGNDGGECELANAGTGVGCLTDAECGTGETCVGVGVDDDIICPTPDSDLISCPIN